MILPPNAYKRKVQPFGHVGIKELTKGQTVAVIPHHDGSVTLIPLIIEERLPDGINPGAAPVISIKEVIESIPAKETK